MEIENLNTQAEMPAQESENTAVSDTENTETPEGESQEPAEPKTFSQEELDAAISKRLAKERRKWERDQREQSNAAPAVASDAPKPEQFKTLEEYVDALSDYKATQKVAEQQAKQHQSKVQSDYETRVDEIREKYDDFDTVAHGTHWNPTPEMAQTIWASEIGPEIAYHLGSNPGEARRIASLPPLLQAREIGKIEAQLTANPPAKKTSSAPAPIKPVGSRSTTPKYDTTDPRSVKTMTDSEWIAAENARRMKMLRG